MSTSIFLIHDFSLEQVVKELTRDDNILDLFLLNQPYLVQNTCADPESFVRAGPTSTTVFFVVVFFSLMWGGSIQMPLLASGSSTARQ